MNCLQCNAPLEDFARFCRSCGSPVAINSPVSPSTSDNSPTMPTPMPQPYTAHQEQWQSPLTLPAHPQWNQGQGAAVQPGLPQPSAQAEWIPQEEPVRLQYAPQAV